MHPTKNTLAEDIRRSAVELLQARLSDAGDLASHAKQAHWNVKGANFIALHELFDQIHGELDDYVDMIAERLVGLGGQAYGTVRESARRSSLAEYPVDATSWEHHVDAFSNSLAAYGKLVREAIDSAAQIGDQDTSDLFTGVSRGIDKSLWFVESHRDTK